ncbi:MAG: transcriptional regulator GcvA [Rhodovibrionaceae bacterium]
MPSDPGRLPSLNALRAFEAAARLGSLTRAAEELHVTTAAVSHQIKALENDLGLKLLRRVGREIAPSEAAEPGLDSLREGFDLLHQAVRRMRARPSGRSLTISIAPSLAALWLIPRLERFSTAHPGIGILLDTKWGRTDFARSPVDLAIRYGPGGYQGYFSRQLFIEEFFPVCAPRLLEGARPLRQPEDLRHHSLIHVNYVHADENWRDWPMWLSAAGVTGIDPEQGLHFYQTDLGLRAAVAGQGVALGTTALVVDLLEQGALLKPFALSLESPLGYYIVCPEESARRGAVAAFIEWVMGEAEESWAALKRMAGEA